MQLRFPTASPGDPAVDAWLAACRDARGDLARAWFARLRACGEDVRELMHDGQATACVGDAPFAYVAVYTAHVGVGFFHGATLPDPVGLLTGTGRYMRHVKLRPGEAIDEAALAALIEAAYRDVQRRA